MTAVTYTIALDSDAIRGATFDDSEHAVIVARELALAVPNALVEILVVAPAGPLDVERLRDVTELLVALHKPEAAEALGDLYRGELEGS